MTAELLTFGCRLNAYESEVMRELTSRADAGDPPQTDTIIVNTCAVTAEAERQARQAIRRAAREHPNARIVVTGCAAQLNPAAWAALPNVVRVLGNQDKLKPESWLPDAPSAVSDIMTARDTAPQLVTGFAGRARSFVQVQQGCDHRCTFCIIPFGRGPSRSVPMGAVVAQVHALVEAGYQEVVLTGVDIASYGPDLPGTPALGQLVRRLLALVPDLPRLRLSSLDPAAIDDDLWRLLADEPRLMPHLHLSLQAGSDLILKRMKRRHLCADARAAIDRARALRPGIAIGADLIAGFPTETDALFAETLAFVEAADLPFLHVFPYSERPGTPAARMPAVPVPLRRERAARLREAGRHAARRFFAAQVGQTIIVLTESGDTGHSEHFAPVRLRAPVQAGTLIAARVVAATDEGLVAENLSREAGEVETRSGEGEGDRVAPHYSSAACRPDHPHPALRAALSRAAGEA
jgi:threonylcarbamoyladenosine tRNA methylthiotransferase MtaB